MILMIPFCRSKFYIILLSLSLVYFLLIPTTIGSSSAELEWEKITFVVNDTLDFGASQTFSYHFSLPLDWVGSHAQIRVQSGVVTGLTPNRLVVIAWLDGVKTSQTFAKTNGLLKHYTFHSSCEYVLVVPPPVRPALENILTLHNLTVSLEFVFSSSPTGNGFVKQIVFETCTPPPVLLTQTQPLVILQERFSWQISQWSFGRCFFNTSVIIPISEPQNLSITANVNFHGSTLEGWQITLKQEPTILMSRDSWTLEGVILIDPGLPCELSVTVDPPQVSEPEIITVNVSLTGLGLPLPQLGSPQLEISDKLTEKRFNEGMFLVQLGLVVVPLLTYYRIRRPKYQSSQQEDNR